jgi:hypothetical protein
MDPRTAPAADAGHDPRRPDRAAVPAPRASARTPRPVPNRDVAFDALDLTGLRAYRTALQAEEGRVSYWRRILQARLDAVRGGVPGRGQASAADLRPLLSDEHVRTGRDALVEVLPVDGIPPLPSLAELWDRLVPVDDPGATAAFLHDLEQAEQQLSSYRAALHVRLGGATGELIARYHEQPALCLTALPLGPRRAGSAG